MIPEPPAPTTAARSWRGKILLGIALGAAVYVGFVAYADWGRVRGALASFEWRWLGVALGLALVNYTLRFFKWQLYLSVLDLSVPTAESALVFVSGFSLTVTPGKLGEVLKSFLLRDRRGIPVARTAPIVVAERLTDLLALALLAVSGVATHRTGGLGVLAGAGLVIVALLLVSSRRAAHTVFRLAPTRFRSRLDEMYDSAWRLLRPTPLALATLLSIGAWFSECVSLWLLVGGFPGAHASLSLATFVYAVTTIAGALSFLPGGLGVTEAGMTGLLVRLGTGITTPVAVAATFLVRLATLWFAVLLGAGALLLHSRRGAAS